MGRGETAMKEGKVDRTCDQVREENRIDDGKGTGKRTMCCSKLLNGHSRVRCGRENPVAVRENVDDKRNAGAEQRDRPGSH